MSEQTFPVGTEVVHKSGGPRMVIVAYSATAGTYTCRWFNDKHQTQNGTFLPGELKLATVPQRRSKMWFVSTSKGL